MKKITGLIILVAMLMPSLLFAQAQIIFNGGFITISNNAQIVLANSASDALSAAASGGIISEGFGNNVKWEIGTAAATYTVPFIKNNVSIPVSFTTSGASGSGYFEFSTYAGPNWQNSSYLPPTVGNVNHNGVDNSAYVIDRFWKVKAVNYTTKPSLSNLKFTYLPVEFSESGNTISEPNLQAQRWNETSSEWGDFGPSGTDNTSTHTVTVASVGSSDLFTWWTLVDNSSALPVTLLNFSAQAVSKTVQLKWTTAAEVNTSTFTIEKSQDFLHVIPVGSLPAAGTSSVQKNYSMIDVQPFSGASYYRLKTLSKDGSVLYSKWIQIVFTGNNQITVFPNPAKDFVYISGLMLPASATASAIICDISGKVIMQQILSNQTTQLNIGSLGSGTYILKIVNADKSMQSFKIIKQ